MIKVSKQQFDPASASEIITLVDDFGTEHKAQIAVHARACHHCAKPFEFQEGGVDVEAELQKIVEVLAKREADIKKHLIARGYDLTTLVKDCGCSGEQK